MCTNSFRKISFDIRLKLCEEKFISISSDCGDRGVKSNMGIKQTIPFGFSFQ